ncbi:spore coat U domain-containing protein [Methylobacter sp. S3L5C]|uniref:Csu type fimbrial protein n=1 Tax=Methylobacter sp. S3L5C TaxID=2839024 RepID=UPI001FABC074|nr:spore coat U domain-containing protein [Methylobacter sp. S3L5C]UOA09793.1 spore coat U domain-containing protein [Methylobacter sp. S3L5C]
MNFFQKEINLAVVLLMLSGQAIQAATTTSTFQVTATVNAACSVSATNLAFGIYNASAAANDNTSTITMTCTKATAYDIGLNAGIASGATVTSRQMKHATLTDLINYSLYSNAGYTTNWGNTVSTDTVHVASASGAAELYTVYGRIASNQYVTAGSYADTITVTVTY